MFKLRHTCLVLSMTSVSCLSVATALAADASGYVLGPQEGEDVFGDGSMLLKATPDTGTQGSVVAEDRMPPGATSGIHMHLEADEFFYVVDGIGRILVGTEEHELTPGDFVFVPFGTDHRITSSQDDPLHVIFVVDRPGLHQQFRAEMDGFDRTQMTLEEFNAMTEPYGTVYKTFD